jgi:carbon monoxide dehydrogenase subunit G
MVDVEVDFKDQIRVPATPDAAFGLVSDIYRSGIHFPSVDRLTRIDDGGRWRWQMKEKGFGPIKVRAAYDAVYSTDPSARRVSWEPPRGGGGDMDSWGSWHIEPDGQGGALLRFHARTVAHIHAPRLMAKMVEALAREELTRLKRQYLSAIAKSLGA